jgi:hypothetical protein
MDNLGLAPGEDAQPVEVAETVETPVAAPEPVNEPVIEVKPEPKPETGHIPISALLDEREKRKALESRLAEFERMQAPQAPDPNLDPVGWQQSQIQGVHQAVIDTRLNMSEVAAKRHYGAELTEAAKQWSLQQFQSNPAFQAQVLNNPDPYDYAITAYQRDQIASQVTNDDFKQFQAWKSAQAQVAAAPAATPQSAPVPRSIASTPSAGGGTQVVIDDDQAFAGAIP